MSKGRTPDFLVLVIFEVFLEKGIDWLLMFVVSPELTTRSVAKFV